MGKAKVKAKKPPKVIVVVSGGVAHVDRKDKGVFLEIIDDDNERECQEGEYEPEVYDADVRIKSDFGR